MKQINKVLVANRGEIARRIIRTLHKMGISSIAIYHEADAESLHVTEAEERFMLEGSDLSATYLNIPKIVEIAKAKGADAIHPGYGFLSENPDFAHAVNEAGLTFIGPSAEVIRMMGHKTEARALAVSLGIPVAEGATGDKEHLLEKASATGFPLLVKAAAGGGGKGMRIAHDARELDEAIDAARREARSYFGNDEVYIEKYLPNPRHIEVQVLADHHGNVFSLYERECSLQRRHQKIVEEAPAPNLSEELRQKMTDAACKLASHMEYTNAGTVEFLVQDDKFYFLEMNTRIQVEHPVTEMITGLDIVKEQVHIAAGREMPYSQEDIRIEGHAIETRVYAEDPEAGFLPSPGKVLLHKIPSDDTLRIDTALAEQGNVSSLFDPMISKVVCHAQRRETARKKMIRHLKEYVLLGVKTNISLLIDILESEEFAEGKTDTGLAGKINSIVKTAKKCEEHEINQDHLFAMAFLFAHKQGEKKDSIWNEMGFWRLMPEANLLINEKPLQVHFAYHSPRKMSIPVSSGNINFMLINKNRHTLTVEVSGCVHTLYYLADNGEVIFQHEGKTARVSPVRHLGKETLRQINENPLLEGDTLVRSPMNGTVIEVSVHPGDQVNKGDTLLILESMKMENRITATAKSFVKQINVNKGQMVTDNTPLILLTDKSKG